MRVLVTRPLPDAEATARDLVARGHEPILAPMLVTEFLDWPDAFRTAPDPLPDAVLATSLNGLRGLDLCPWHGLLRDRAVFVPGRASAHRATGAGFSDVRPALGDASAIAGRVEREMPAGSYLLYIAGESRTGDIDTRLTNAGYRVDLVEIYRARPVRALPDEALEHLRAGKIDRVTIFSTRTAAAFVDCLSNANLLAGCRDLTIHVISHQAAVPLIEAGFRDVIIASRPDAAELLDTLETGR